MGEENNALNVYMNRADRVKSVLEYYLGEKLPEDWCFEAEDGFYSVRNSKGKLSFRQRDLICTKLGNPFSAGAGESEHDKFDISMAAYGNGLSGIWERN